MKSTVAQILFFQKSLILKFILSLARSVAEDHAKGGNPHVLVHCHMGISRSTAAMAILLAQIRQKEYETAVFAELLRLQPDAWPNCLMIELADKLLGRQGQLTAALGSLYGLQLARKGLKWGTTCARTAGDVRSISRSSRFSSNLDLSPPCEGLHFSTIVQALRSLQKTTPKRKRRLVQPESRLRPFGPGSRNEALIDAQPPLSRPGVVSHIPELFACSIDLRGICQRQALNTFWSFASCLSWSGVGIGELSEKEKSAWLYRLLPNHPLSIDFAHFSRYRC